MRLTHRNRRVAFIYLMVGLIGILLLYSVALIPFVQRIISQTETTIFFSLNPLLGKNPVWDWTILLGTSEPWVNMAYGMAFIIFAIDAWIKRARDYGRLYGYMLFVIMVALITETTADLIADNLHRVLPWKEGITDDILATYDANFFDTSWKEGIVDDACSALTCLYLLTVLRSAWTALAILAMLLIYIGASMIAGTQWITVQIASILLGGLFAGLALNYLGPLRNWLEHKCSQTLINIGAHFILEGRLREERTNPAAGLALSISRRVSELRTLGKNYFWKGLVLPQVLTILQIRDSKYKLYNSPRLSFEKVKSDKRVRFLRHSSGVYVIRATQHHGGILHQSAHFKHFVNGIRNTLYLERLGFRVPRVIWTQEGLTSFGLRSYLIAIEEYLEIRPLDRSQPDEIGRAMHLLARMHLHTSHVWGGIYAEHDRSRSLYLLGYLRGHVQYHLRKIERLCGFRLNLEEFETIWRLFESEAVSVLNHPSTCFRLIHGDVSPDNLCVRPDGSIQPIDFHTLRYDLVGWEIIKATVTLTRPHPEYMQGAWLEYFHARSDPGWEEFQIQARLTLAQFILREMAQGRVRYAHTPPSKEEIMNRINTAFTHADQWFGTNPEDSKLENILTLIGHWAPAQK